MAEKKKPFSWIIVIILVIALGSAVFISYSKFKQKLSQADALALALQRIAQANSNNLKSTAEELKRAKEDLRVAQGKLANIEESQILPLRKKIDELNNINEEKEMKVLAFEKEYERLDKAYSSLKTNQLILERKISELSAAKKGIIDQIEGVQAGSSETDSTGKGQDKTNKKTDINAQLARLKSQKDVLNKRIVQQSKTIDKLKTDNSMLQEESSKISLKLTSKNSDFDVRQKETNKLKNEIAQLQVTVDNLERELFNVHVEQVEKNSTIEVLNIQKENLEKETKGRKFVRESPDKIKKIQKEKLAAQLRLSSKELELARKNETIAALENNIGLLSKQLLQKEQQQKSLEETIYQNNNLKGSSQKQLAQQQAQITELNLLNESLKLKLSEFSAALANKEFELQKTNNKVALLEKEAYDLEKQLKEVKRISGAKYDAEPKSSSQIKDNTEAMKRKLDEILKQ